MMTTEPTYTVRPDFTTKTVTVYADGVPVTTYLNREALYRDWPELRPAPPTAADERRLVRMEASARVQGGVGYSRSGRRS